MLVIIFIVCLFIGLYYLIVAAIGIPAGILKLGYDALKPEAVEARRLKKQAKQLKKQKQAEEAERIKREAEYLEEAKKTWEFK